MVKLNKAKAHHSFLRNDALKCNVPNIQKTGKGLKKILQVHLPQIVFYCADVVCTSLFTCDDNKKIARIIAGDATSKNNWVLPLRVWMTL